MSPKRPGGQAFRAVGGDIVSRGGTILTDSDFSLLAHLGREAMRCDQAGDRAAARTFALMARDLARALLAVNDWRRAAGEPPRG